MGEREFLLRAQQQLYIPKRHCPGTLTTKRHYTEDFREDVPWCVPWSSDAEASAKKVSAGMIDSKASAGPLVPEEKVTLRVSMGGTGGQQKIKRQMLECECPSILTM